MYPAHVSRVLLGLVALGLVIACSSRSVRSDDAETSGSSTTASESSSGSSESGELCDPNLCDQSCAGMLSDECELPYEGSCVDGACSCEPPSCPECHNDDDCPPWHQCAGGCFPCGELVVGWDPELGCTITLADFPPWLAPYAYVELDDFLPYTDDCMADPDGWSWIDEGADTDSFVLCPDACAAFEAAGQLTFGSCIAGE